MEWRERDGVRWLEAELPAARAAFSSRVGGISEEPYDALNVAIMTGDERERVQENRRRLAGVLGRDPEGVVMGRQVHGAKLREHRVAQTPRIYADVEPSPEEVDAHSTSSAELTPLVMVADCLPVAMSGPRGVAMAHCGWRGLAGGIVAEVAAAVDAQAAAVARGLLARAGVTAVESADLCTKCNPELFYSHRRDGERTGRQAGLAWMA
jgi:copper oxidase (laccase) domain-containing protein